MLLAPVSYNFGPMKPHTFGIGPVGIQIRQGCLVAYLLERLGRLMVDLEDTARSPPTATRVVAIGHVEVGASASASAAGRLVARVEGDGALEENWGRQLGGIAGGYRGAGAWNTATSSQTLSDPGGDSACRYEYDVPMYRRRLCWVTRRDTSAYGQSTAVCGRAVRSNRATSRMLERQETGRVP